MLLQDTERFLKTINKGTYMFGMEMLRDKLDTHARHNLTKYEGSLVLMKREGGSFSFVKVGIKLERYLWKIFPLYEIKERGYRCLQVFTDIVQPIKEIQSQLMSSIKGHSRTVWKVVISGMINRLCYGLDDLKKEAGLKAEQGYKLVHDKFLFNVISKSQIEFRQRLTEVVKKTASETFVAIVHKHLAMLVVKMREEETQRSQSDYVSSGPTALPFGCKFVFKKRTAIVYVVEQIPQVKTVTYLGDSYRISLPYVVFTVSIKDNKFIWMQVFFRNAPLNFEADELLCPAFPNIGAGEDKPFVVCFPPPRFENPQLTQIVNEAVQNYWGSNFNKDLSAYFEAAGSQFPQVRSFNRWERETTKDPQFALKIPWQTAGMSVSQLANRSLNRVLSINTGRPAELSTIDVLQEFTENLGVKLSREMTEKIHFMVSHSHIDVNGLRPAQEEIEKLLQTTTQDLKNRVDRLLSAPISEEALQELCKEGEKKLLSDVETICVTPLWDIVAKVNQLS